MITIANERPVDLRDIILRSPIAELPGAEETLRRFMRRSVEIRYGLLDGRAACMWGLIPPTILSTNAYLWLLTTDIVAEHKFLFVRHSQRYVEEALKQWPTLVGDCVVGNDSAIRWLKWLGAEFAPAEGGRITFVIRAKNG